MVVIKDFQMPQSCGQCDFLDNYGYCLALHGEFEIIKQDTVETEQEKQKERIEGELDYLDGIWIY